MTLRSVARTVLPKKVRARLRRRPVWMGGLRRLAPVSPDFGVGRGTPVDRHYIARFIDENADAIRGRVLEIGEQLYVREPGAFEAREAREPLPPVRAGVDQVDIVDLSASNPQATIVADLGDPAAEVPAAAFDCVLCTQTLQFVYDVRAAIATLHRSLKPGGTLLVTIPGISQIAVPDLITSPGIDTSDYPEGSDGLRDYWRFTPASAEALFAERFGRDRVTVNSFGSVLTSMAFLHGLTVEDLRRSELEHADPRYPLLLAVRAVRTD